MSSLGEQSEALFRQIVAEWQYVGPIRLVGGPDPPTTIEPDEFMTFAAGHLDEFFIATTDQFERRRYGTAATRDRHGRHRVEKFLCFNNMWRPVVSDLIHETDLVLIDVRSFAPGNDGARLELTFLAQLGMLRRTALVVDGATDRRLLADALEAGGGRLTDATLVSPNRDQGLTAALLTRLSPA